MNNFIANQFGQSRSSSRPPSETNSSGTRTGASSTPDTENASSFRSFWRKYDKSAQPSNVTFVEQDPSGKKKPNRISRLLRKASKTSSLDAAEDADVSSAQKRRQQVYQAQKRHRNRKADYVHTLEAEVARLQHLDAIINNEKNSIAHENKLMRDLLASRTLDFAIDNLDLSSSSNQSDGLSQLGGAAVDIRFDPQMGHERTFLDLSDVDMLWTSSETSGGEDTDRTPQTTPVPGDSWAALDFILALEWPCKEHIKHHVINPDVTIPPACAVSDLHGHALTATASVYQSALPPRQPVHGVHSDHHGLDPASQDKWQLPHSEIDKLVELSELLELDDDSLTPAQAYTAIRGNLPNEKLLRPMLEALKTPLASLVQCHGFGACMDAPMFWQHYDATVEALKFTRPDLE